MATLPPGGGRRTASLGSGSSRSRSVVIGRPGRGTTILAPVQEGIGSIFAFATVDGYSDFLISGSALLQEIGDSILLETGDRLLIEDAASTGISAGEAFPVRGVGAALADALGTSAGITTVSGVMEEPGPVGDTLLLEIGDDILLENGDLILLETGAVPPAGIILDTLDQEISDTSGDFILEV
jgi:hypothetical protein